MATKAFNFNAGPELLGKINLLLDMGHGLASRFIREACLEKWAREGLDRISDYQLLVRRIYELLPVAEGQAGEAIRDLEKKSRPQGLSLDQIMELKERSRR